MKKNERWQLPSLKSVRTSKKDIRYFNFELSKDYIGLGKNKKYYIRTYGCQANERDTELMSGILKQLGYQASETLEESDLIILNTCAVRRTAEDKVLGELGQLKRLKRENPDLIIGLAGCISQEEEMVQFIIEKYPHVDLIFGTHNINRLPQLLSQCIFDQLKVVEVYSDTADIIESLPSSRKLPHKAWINIMYGCDKFCTYCIVPYTRGKQRSRKEADILSEVYECVESGYQEITLLGQNVNAYGKDFAYQGGFSTLLAKVAESGIARVRFVTSHPWDFSDSMVEVIAKYDNIMPYIHLPLQAGSDEILKKMGRRYSVKDYLKIFDKLKAEVTNASFSTDIIVGFPGESEEQFQDTLKMVEYCKFDNIFSFIYSPRENTPAALLVDDVTKSEKSDRLQRLNNLFKPFALENAKAYVGKIEEILVDGKSKRNDEVYSGYTTTNKLVNFTTTEKIEIGDLVMVRIDQAKTFTLDGVMVGKKL
ncbi:MAG: tRNA (N6-isopentenyl adenosine(37)-C2)-methylthiotransferase MiaB [Erysipelotrichaceae bacterium]